MFSFLFKQQKTIKTNDNPNHFYSISMDKQTLHGILNEEHFKKRALFNSKKNVKNCNLII